MELRDLRVFVTVVEERGFSRAAGRLHLVQSAVSDAVARLERELGLRLLERGRQGAVPTEAGERLLTWARLILNSAAGATAELAALRGLAAASVRLGMLPTTAALVLPSLLPVLRERLPGLEVRIEEGLAPALVDLVASGDLDFAVLFFPAGRRPELTFAEVAAAPLALLLNRGHRLAGRRSVHLDEAADEAWVTFPPANPGRLWLEEACRLAGFTPRVGAAVPTPVQQKIFVEAGYGIAMVPFGAAAWWRPLRAVSLEGTLPEFRIGYACDPRRPEGALTQVRAILDTVLASLVPAGARPGGGAVDPGSWALPERLKPERPAETPASWAGSSPRMLRPGLQAEPGPGGSARQP